jgi:4'-phosphopantetheinyl transferase
MFDLRRPPAEVAALAALLSPDETARAGRFRFADLRRRYVVARASLRQLVAARLGLQAPAVTFAYTSFGKPYLAPRPPAHDNAMPAPAAIGGHLEFNVAHAGDLALIALTWARRVGVDVEPVRPLPDLASVAQRFFAPAEQAALAALLTAERTAAFFQIWTRKEALLKASGEGLSRSLAGFAVPLGEIDVCLLLPTGEPGATASTAPALLPWRLLPLPAPPGFCAALAVEGDGEVEVRIFPPALVGELPDA